jgi:hypothetical protein
VRAAGFLGFGKSNLKNMQCTLEIQSQNDLQLFAGGAPEVGSDIGTLILMCIFAWL